jgi:hypothetical protein
LYVVGHGGVVHDVDLGGGTGAFGNVGADTAHGTPDFLLPLLVERPDGAGQLHLLGNDVVAHPAAYHAHRQHGRIFGQLRLAADDGLQAHNNLRGRHH